MNWNEFMEKLSVKVDDSKISKILDIYTEYISADSTNSDNGLKLNGKINLCILALNEDGKPTFIERSFDYEHFLNSVSDCNELMSPDAKAISMSYRLADDNTVELRCEIKVNGIALKKNNIRAVKNVELFEDKPIVNDDCALTLYFAGKGENLWDIAKSHKTRLDMLLTENSADNIILDSPQMLLIPRI